MKKHIKANIEPKNYGLEEIEAAGAFSLEDLFEEHGNDLEPSGHNFMTNCPFHDDKKESCCVIPSDNHFHCLECHTHGNAIDYMMQRCNLSFLEAMESLLGE